MGVTQGAGRGAQAGSRIIHAAIHWTNQKQLEQADNRGIPHGVD